MKICIRKLALLTIFIHLIRRKKKKKNHLLSKTCQKKKKKERLIHQYCFVRNGKIISIWTRMTISMNLAYTVCSVLTIVAHKNCFLKICTFSLSSHKLTLQSKPSQVA